MNNRDYIFIADSHLRNHSAEDFFAMLEQLRRYAPAGVIFLGDIFELWIALDGYETDLHRRFLTWCSQAKQQFEVGFILGNHEFYAIHRHADAFSWICETEHTLPGGIRCLHGDLINRGDHAYLFLRKFLRSGFTRFLLRITAATIGPRISNYVLNSLKTTNQRHKRNLPLTHLEQYARQAAAESVQYIAAGHFHRHERLTFPDGAPLEILPAWDIAGEIVRLTPDLHTECAPWRQILTGKGNDAQP